VILRAAAGLLACLAAALFVLAPSPHRKVLQLPPGVLYVQSEMVVGPDVEVRGAPSGTTLRFAPKFSGRALIVVKGWDVALRDFTVEGDRAVNDGRSGLPPYDRPFSKFTRGNGVLAESVGHLRISGLHFREISGFAILLSAVTDVAIDHVAVSDSGSRNPAGRNNTSGGILLEEGTYGFQVTGCDLRNVRGNGIWTHSLYTSPRNARGLIARNRFTTLGRDAIQVGHATGVRVEENSGRWIGYPEDDTDIAGGAYPVAIDTAGNVDRSVYAGNVFRDINGKCIDLDGFHDGEIRGNTCVNLRNYGIVMNNTNPDMQSQNIRVVDNVIDGAMFGAIFVIGHDNLVARNRFVNIKAGPGPPGILSAGIYLGERAERPGPARNNIIEDNVITGNQMATRCVLTAPAIRPAWNTIRNNVCRADR
jgi:hypothetical protein